MAKPPAWRQQLDIYPFQVTVDPRYGDLDIMGHVNNVAMASIFETARIKFHRHLGRHPQDLGVRWLVAAVEINYLLEAHYPASIIVGSAIGAIGNTSWTVKAAAFQDGDCVASCDAVIAMQGPEGRRRISDDLRGVFMDNFIREPEA
jgi:acyl-CoA thioester hydrolase